MSASEISVITVLGQGLVPGGVPSDLLKERCRMAAKLAVEMPQAVVIPTGGDPAEVGVTEAAAMMDILSEHGVPRNRILLEEQAYSTASNALYVLGMARDLSGSGRLRLLLVTSGYHMPRSAWNFKIVAQKLGIDLVLEQHRAPWVWV